MLDQEQKDRLQLLHSYDWADDNPVVTESNLDKIFAAISTPEELWFASIVVQWSPKNRDLDRILNHPQCDKGLSLFLYWALDPIQAYDRNDTDPIILEILQNIEFRNTTSFPSGSIAFIPPANHRVPNTIPSHMCHPTPGNTLPVDYRESVFGQ